LKPRAIMRPPSPATEPVMPTILVPGSPIRALVREESG
jgi:hypothetical protein